MFNSKFNTFNREPNRGLFNGNMRHGGKVMVFLENMRAFLPTIVLVLAVGLSIIAICLIPFFSMCVSSFQAALF
jgi:hypothetical protein